MRVVAFAVCVLVFAFVFFSPLSMHANLKGAPTISETVDNG